MIQIDMEMPKFCWWMDGDDYRKCPMVDGKNGCCLHSNVCYATWEEQYKHCPLHEVTDTDTVSRKPETTTEIQKILDYLDNELHPLVSPDNWNVYSELYDMVSELENLPPSPSRPKGRWIDRNDNVATCSVCGERWGLYRMLNFCPHCGADMRQQEGGAV